MKLFVVVLMIFLLSGGYYGRPYIDMISDGQSFECVMEQVRLDIVSDGSLKDEVAKQSNAAKCKAEALLDKATQ